MPLRQLDIIIFDLDDAENSGFALEEMFSYNSSWYNLTLAGQHYMWGEAQYIPIYGAGGVILFFGGFWPSDRRQGMENESPNPSTLATLDSILIYDIHTNRFFKQLASNPPPARALFCSVAAGASNDESYEMCISPTFVYNIRTLLITIDAASSTEAHRTCTSLFLLSL